MADPRVPEPESQRGSPSPSGGGLSGGTRQRASAAKSAGWRLPAWFTTGDRPWLKIAAVVGGVILLLILGTFAYAVATLPDPSKLDLAGGAVGILDRHGVLI